MCPEIVFSLKLTASLPLKIGFHKRKGSSEPTIHFQVLLLLVSGMVDSRFQQVETLNHLILMVKVWKFISTAIVLANL